jgi:cytidine deaminase
MWNYLLLAAREANKSKSRFKLGALCFSRGKVISKAFNRNAKPRLTSRKGECTWHAEQIAINRAKRFNIDEILVVRVNNKQELLMSMPCKRCNRLLKKAGVQTVWYIDWNSQLQKISIR